MSTDKNDPVKDDTDQTCGCRWERDSAGHPEFRECAEHYVVRVTRPGVTAGGESDG